MGTKLTKEQLREAMREMGRRGGKSRLKNSTPEQRKQWASLGAKFGKLGGRPPKNKPKGGSK